MSLPSTYLATTIIASSLVAQLNLFGRMPMRTRYRLTGYEKAQPRQRWKAAAPRHPRSAPPLHRRSQRNRSEHR